MRTIDMRRTLNRYADTITVYETIGIYVDHLWNQAKQPNRTIKASVLNASPQKMKILSDGAVRIGGIAIHTTDILYFLDTKSQVEGAQIQNLPDVNSLETGIPSAGETTLRAKQSFVIWRSLTYRVVADASPSNAKYRTFLGTRYIDNQSDGISQ
jgi:hypothetical protein